MNAEWSRTTVPVRASMKKACLGSFIGKNLVDKKIFSIKLNNHFANTKKVIFCILFNDWTEFILLIVAATLTVDDIWLRCWYSGNLSERIVNQISCFSNGFFIIRCNVFKSRCLKIFESVTMDGRTGPDRRDHLVKNVLPIGCRRLAQILEVLVCEVWE